MRKKVLFIQTDEASRSRLLSAAACFPQAFLRDCVAIRGAKLSISRLKAVDLVYFSKGSGESGELLAIASACARAGVPFAVGGESGEASCVSFRLPDERVGAIAAFAEDFLAGKAACEYRSSHPSQSPKTAKDSEALGPRRRYNWLKIISAKAQRGYRGKLVLIRGAGRAGMAMVH